MLHTLATPAIDHIQLPLFNGDVVAAKMLRLDSVDQRMSGNKAYKLLPNIEFALDRQYDTLLSFGGTFSNHIYALALAGQKYGLKTVAVIRGESSAINNPTLSAATSAGLKCHFVDRQTYRQRHEPAFIDAWQKRYPGALIIPEGGSNALAELGCANLGRQLRERIAPASRLLIAVGTGTTARGLQQGLVDHAEVVGVPVLNGLEEMKGIALVEDCHHGGYAKLTPALVEHMQYFERINNIELDPVYTAKMVWAASVLVEQGRVDSDQLLLVHSGGVQGKQGMLDQLIRLGYHRGTCT